jgi:predicted permease
MTDDFVSGCITTMCIFVALFQLRFWARTRDRLFLFFTVAFTLMALNRIGLSIVADESETRTYFYVVRLVAFVLIIVGIWDKNKRARPGAS